MLTDVQRRERYAKLVDYVENAREIAGEMLERERSDENDARCPEHVNHEHVETLERRGNKWEALIDAFADMIVDLDDMKHGIMKG